MKDQVFWEVTRCRARSSRHFEGYSGSNTIPSKRRELVDKRHSVESSTPPLCEASNLASPKVSEITIGLICYMKIAGTNSFVSRRLAISSSIMERIPDVKLYTSHRNRPPPIIFHNLLQYLTTGIQKNTSCQKNIIQFEEPHNKF